jgi:hypothetical protein
MTGVGAIVLILLAAGIAGGGSPEEDTTATTATGAESPQDGGDAELAEVAEPEGSEEQAEPVDRGPGIGDAARDGKFEFRVTALECGKTRIGDAYLNAKAQGQFCLLRLRVENIGDEARTFDGSNQYLFDAGDRKYEADTEAGIYLDDSQSFLEEINPGNTVKGVVIFDVPKKFKATKAELHDSMFSGGVEVALR